MRLYFFIVGCMSILTLTACTSRIQATVSGQSLPNQIDQSEPNQKAMTWRILSLYSHNEKLYALFGSDNVTNPYQGDTEVKEVKSLLCIKKKKLPAQSNLPPTTTTPGGALRGSWSGAMAVIVPNVKGVELTSLAVANEKCSLEGMKIWKEEGFQMAEFHDGDREAGWAGWDFWVEIPTRQNLVNDRYWVWINDQPANPW